MYNERHLASPGVYATPIDDLSFGKMCVRGVPVSSRISSSQSSFCQYENYDGNKSAI